MTHPPAAGQASLRARALALAIEALATRPLAEPVTILFRTADGSESYRISSRPGELESVARLSGLTEMQRTVAEVYIAAGHELNIKQVARLTGYKNNSRLRQTVRELITAGVLCQRPDDFYGLAGAGQPKGDVTP